MKENTPSRTAQYMALFRAIESERPADKRLFNDKFAINFLDSGLKAAAKFSALPIVGSIIPKIIHHQALGALSSGTARTKYIDDLLQQTIEVGMKQVIILGAGFDTRALRLDFLKNIPVIEVDHPNTSKYKREKLNQSGEKLPGNVQYLQLDFNKESLEQLAQRQKMDFNVPTTIIWEGVTNYLAPEAIDKTFDFVEKFTIGSCVIFTYVHKHVLDSPQSFTGTEKFFKKLAESEERWTFGFLPSELANYLKRFELTLVEDVGAADYRRKYMPERKSLLNGYEFYRVAFARKMA